MQQIVYVWTTDHSWAVGSTGLQDGVPALPDYPAYWPTQTGPDEAMRQPYLVPLADNLSILSTD